MKREKEKESAVLGTSSVKSAIAIEDTQWVKYKNEKTGHGFSAEDANAMHEQWRLKKVEKVGVNNEKDGADRIVNGESIQTKYYKTAEESVSSAFDKDTGIYRYKDQKLEVPRDQYDRAVIEMAQKIRDGKVPGVTDPKDATKIVKQGDVTYQQAKNIAKAGNIDSLKFDLQTQSVAALYGFGISFVIQYANCIWSGMNQKEALKFSITTGLKTGTVVLGTGVITQQFLRTGAGRSFAAFTSSISKRVIDQLYKSEIGKKIIHKIATVMLGKNLAGAAAKNVVIKLLRTNLVTATVTTTIMTIPDFYKALVESKISWKQFSKNLVVNVAGVAGGIGGGIAGATGGAVAGATFGTLIGGPAGTVIGAGIGKVVGGLIGGIGGGIGSAAGTKALADKITDDDAKEMFNLVQNAIAQLAEDYMLTEDEFIKSNIEKTIKETVNQKWLEKMYQTGAVKNGNPGRLKFACDEFEKSFEDIIRLRPIIQIPVYKEYKKELRKTTLHLFIQYLKAKILFWTKKSKIILASH